MSRLRDCDANSWDLEKKYRVGYISDSVAPASAPSLARTALYKVKRGDTLVTIADRFA